MTLEAILPIVEHNAGYGNLAECLNTKAGKNQLGAVDVALKCNKHIAPILKRYGGKEQQPPPADWKQDRRRSWGW